MSYVCFVSQLDTMTWGHGLFHKPVKTSSLCAISNQVLRTGRMLGSLMSGLYGKEGWSHWSCLPWVSQGRSGWPQVNLPCPPINPVPSSPLIWHKSFMFFMKHQSIFFIQDSNLCMGIGSVQFSRSVVSDSLWPHEWQWCHLSSPSPSAPNPSQHQSLFQWVNSSHEVAKVLEFQL